VAVTLAKSLEHDLARASHKEPGGVQPMGEGGQRAGAAPTCVSGPQVQPPGAGPHSNSSSQTSSGSVGLTPPAAAAAPQGPVEAVAPQTAAAVAQAVALMVTRSTASRV
jgi:hypothetical protein